MVMQEFIRVDDPVILRLLVRTNTALVQALGITRSVTSSGPADRHHLPGPQPSAPYSCESCTVAAHGFRVYQAGVPNQCSVAALAAAIVSAVATRRVGC